MNSSVGPNIVQRRRHKTIFHLKILFKVTK